MQNFIETIINELNPANVNFGDFSNVFVYGLKVLLFTILIGLIIYAVINFRKIILFIRQTVSELRKVEWLKRSETIKLTTISLATIVLFVLFLTLVDTIFSNIRTAILF